MPSSTDNMWVNVSWMPHSSLSQTSHVSLAVRSIHANLEDVSSAAEPTEWRVTVAVRGMAGSPLCTESSTPAAPVYPRKNRKTDDAGTPIEQTLAVSPTTHDCFFDEFVQVPVRWRDLPRDSYLQLEVMGPSLLVIFRTSLALFDECGKLRTGLQRLELFRDQSAHYIVQKNPGLSSSPRLNMHADCQDEDAVWKASCILDELERLDKSTTPVKEGGAEAIPPSNAAGAAATDSISFGNVPSVPWLDAMLKRSCRDILLEEEKRDMQEVTLVTEVDEDTARSYLVLEFPTFDIPVMHEETFYPVPPQGASGSVTALDLSLHRQTAKLRGQSSERNEPDDTELVPFLDHENESDNPVEDKYRTLAHDLLRGLVDPALKPDKEQRARLAAIIASPSHHPTREEKDLLWRFRFSLVDNRRALTKFLLAVDWMVESEVVQAAELLEQWRKRSPIEVTDALKLLGKHVAFQTSLVKAYAIDTLAAAPDDELQLYLLQLVQALKYENEGSVDRLPSNLGSSGNSPKGKKIASSSVVSSLASFLVDRASKNIELANYLYWYLKVELQDPTHGARYRAVFSALQERLSASPIRSKHATETIERCDGPVASEGGGLQGENGREQRTGSLMAIVDSVSKLGSSLRSSEHSPEDHCHPRNALTTTSWDILVAQDDFISGIMDCQMQSRDARGKKDAKEAYLRDLLASEGYDRLQFNEPVPLPSCPRVLVNGVNPHTAKMFKSALYPALIEFRVDESSPHRNAKNTVSGQMDSSSRSGKANPRKYKVMLKTGDDLRQDQLVIMMIKLMDGLLKRGTLDLCLKPYSILATSPSSGLVEFVDGSIPISQILASHNNSILQFFQTYAPLKGAKYNVQPEVMQTYLRSCAGYCVITYIIGVGDRHLDNIMLQPSGHFFHVDFGFIFGRDPKPLPPAFRLTREMVDGMGGVDSAEYRQFCSLACQAFNTLRKSAGLVLNLLHLMSDADIEDLANNPSADAEGVIAKVEERFRLELTDEQAERFFLGLINDSLAALAPRVMDLFHSLAVARR